MERNEEYEILRIQAEALYDHMDVRISSMNRLRSYLRRKLEGLGYEKENKGEKSETAWPDNLIQEYLEDAVQKNRISQEDKDYYDEQMLLAKKESVIEKEYENRLSEMLESEDIWTKGLKNIKGISTKNAIRLLKWFGYCENFDSVAKLWAYSGLHVVDGKAPKRKAGEQLSYNLKVKTACWIIGDCLIKSNKDYKRLYDNYKARIIQRGCCDKAFKPKKKGGEIKYCKDSPGHAHSMAKRYMVKIFLSHYWHVARTLRGLPTRSPYAIEYLKHQTYINPKEFGWFYS